MIAALVAFVAMITSPLPAPTRHFVLHEDGHATIIVHHKHLRAYWFTRGGVVSVERMRNVGSGTVMTFVATNAGSTAVTVNCDGGKEVWLVDVR